MKRKISAGLTLLLTFAVYAVTAEAASISGTAVYDGEAPKFREIKMDADPVCLSHHTASVVPQTLVLSANNEMRNVLVFISSGAPKKAYETPGEVVLDQKGCMYEPHVLGVMINQPIKILNPDGTLHNVHALPKINAEFNLAMPKFLTEKIKSFDKEEIKPFPMKCDVHPWMGAWISVFSHPYFNVTGEDGKFSIDDLPAGEYEITAWHEKLPPQKSTITLADGDSQEVNFTFSRPKKKQ